MYTSVREPGPSKDEPDFRSGNHLTVNYRFATRLHGQSSAGVTFADVKWPRRLAGEGLEKHRLKAVRVSKKAGLRLDTSLPRFYDPLHNMLLAWRAFLPLASRE